MENPYRIAMSLKFWSLKLQACLFFRLDGLVLKELAFAQLQRRRDVFCTGLSWGGEMRSTPR